MHSNKNLKQIHKPPTVPSYFLSGIRHLQIHHTRLRNKCSNLNSDLYNNHLRDNAACACGCLQEDAEHYFFHCPLYRDQRIQLFHSTRTYHPISLNKLLFGIETETNIANTHIFNAVQRYIKNTKRFDQPT